MGIKSDLEVDKAVEKFTVELLTILLAKDISLLDKRQITFVHLSENKIWAFHVIGGLCILILAISSLYW